MLSGALSHLTAASTSLPSFNPGRGYPYKYSYGRCSAICWVIFQTHASVLLCILYTMTRAMRRVLTLARYNPSPQRLPYPLLTNHFLVGGSATPARRRRLPLPRRCHRQGSALWNAFHEFFAYVFDGVEQLQLIKLTPLLQAQR